MKTPEQCNAHAGYDVIRADMIESINRYVTDGVPPGGFLRALLANDLKESFGRADSHNRMTMFNLVCYVVNEIPASCHGSSESVVNWIEAGGLNGMKKSTTPSTNTEGQQ